MSPAQVLDIFRKSGALLEGHFILRSGLHSRQVFQCAHVLQYPHLATKLCLVLARHIDASKVDSIISPALGGILVGQEMGRIFRKRHIFAEKENGQLVLHRGFIIKPGERFLVAEDVVTQGGRVMETIKIVQDHGGIVMAVAVLVDRSTKRIRFGIPFYSLIKIKVKTFPTNRLPKDLKTIPAVKPGSK